MATFRSGFKIFGELSFRQNIGRIRSVSEGRKPGSWSPEDQWAVRPPGTTCPDPRVPKKPVKPARSWLSICKDPPEYIPCDIRHNNCPPPKETDEPWYAFLTKKKPPVKLPARNACRMEIQRQAEEEIEPYCNEMEDHEWPCDYVAAEPSPPPCSERQPAPVIRLSCPPPKDLDLMLWCGRPGLSVSRIAAQCHSDKMPYEEFRPRKMWKPPPFSMPNKFDAPPQQPFCSNVGRAPLSEYKQVDIPKPLYTRYKSVELEDENFLLCMTDAKCPGDEEDRKKSPLQPPPVQKAQPPPPPPKPKVDISCERPILVAASQKPVRLRCAPKFEFRSKPTKLIERRPVWNPCAQHKACNMSQIEPPASEASTAHNFSPNECVNAPKVITGSLTDEPQTFQRNFMSRRPPHWMFMLSKPGSKNTPLVPHTDSNPTEPDWCDETDGLKLCDGHEEGIFPKPRLDPCKRPANRPDTTVCSPPPPPPPLPQDEVVQEPKEKFVLMPEKYNIRNKRPPEEEKNVNLEDVTFQEFIDAKTTNVRTCSKLYPQMKENILYDLVRNCPLPPIDPTKADPPPRKPDCPQPIRYQNRKYSTFSPCHLRKPLYAKVFNRLKSDDHSGKCKPRKLAPKPKECKETIESSCNETEMPCCPKARIPPKCNVKKALPPCKKKLPPKPAYSECSRDPNPCPKITECNAWDKSMNNKPAKKGRRGFSSWAPEQEDVSLEKDVTKSEPSLQAFNLIGDNNMASGPSYSEFLDLKNRGPSLNKNKWSSHKQRKVFSGKELMLNFVNPTEDANSYYKSESLVRRRKSQWRKLNSAQPKSEMVDDSVGNQEIHEKKVISALLQDHHTRNVVGLKSLSLNNNEGALRVSNSAEENRSKAIVSSIGSWINGIVKGSKKKRSTSCPPAMRRTGQHSTMSYVETVDVDRIMKLTKPYRQKTKSQSLDSLTYYPMNTSTDYRHPKIPSPFKRFWGRNRNRALLVFPQMKKQRAQSSMWKYECLSPSVDFQQNDNSGKSIVGGQPSGKTNQQPMKEVLSRLDIPKLKGPIRSVEGFSGRSFVLNLHNQVTRQYSNMNVFGTYAELTGNKKGRKSNVSMLGIASKFLVMSRGLAKASKSRQLLHINLEQSRINASSHVVQNLPKKTKSRKSDLESPKTSKAKFMQSATSYFVANAIAKKEQETTKSLKKNSEKTMSSTAERALMALSPSPSSWLFIDKGYEPNSRLDLKKSNQHGTIMKSKSNKWLQDVDELSNVPKGKNPRDDILKENLRYGADKNVKRREVWNMLSKLDTRNPVLKVSENSVKSRQKEYNKKGTLDNRSDSQEDALCGRFGWQHALFRNNVREVQKSVREEVRDPPDQSCITETRLLIEPPKSRALIKSVSESSLPEKLNNNVELYDANLDILQDVNIDYKTCSLSVDNLKEAGRSSDQTSRVKWTNTQKSAMKSRENIIGSFTCGKESSLPLQKKEVRPIMIAAAKSNISLSTRRFTEWVKFSGAPKDNCSCPEKKKNFKGCTVEEREGRLIKEDTQTSEKLHEEEEAVEDDPSCRKSITKKPGPNCPE